MRLIYIDTCAYMGLNLWSVFAFLAAGVIALAWGLHIWAPEHSTAGLESWLWLTLGVSCGSFLPVLLAVLRGRE